MTKKMKAYAAHLKKTFKDGFPNGTAYQKAETKGFKVEFERGEVFTKVFMTVPVWTIHGQIKNTVLHTLIAENAAGYKRGTILKPKTLTVKGHLNADWNGLAWNVV